MDFEGITTRTGDQGDTGKYSGERLPKDDLIFDITGGVDELNSWLGLLRAHISHGLEVGYIDPVNCEHQLVEIQKDLFRIGAETATSRASELYTSLHLMEYQDTDRLESWQSQLMKFFRLPQDFIIPGSTKMGARIDIARTVARRLERSYVHFLRSQPEEANPAALRYLNRLSDYLFSLARFYEQK